MYLSDGCCLSPAKIALRACASSVFKPTTRGCHCSGHNRANHPVRHVRCEVIRIFHCISSFCLLTFPLLTISPVFCVTSSRGVGRFVTRVDALSLPPLAGGQLEPEHLDWRFEWWINISSAHLHRVKHWDEHAKRANWSANIRLMLPYGYSYLKPKMNVKCFPNNVSWQRTLECLFWEPKTSVSRTFWKPKIASWPNQFRTCELERVWRMKKHLTSLFNHSNEHIIHEYYLKRHYHSMFLFKMLLTITYILA